jgi:thiamine biosynthesis protein ThiS|tara:strand:- start:28244 stop:28447 length:204 start_codon:yes stop_codon:yes gene_type:complete
MKVFFLNGQKYCSESNFTLLDLLNYFNYDLNIFVLEHNKLIRKKENWNQIKIKNNDTIEIITIVGGG